MAGAEPFEGGDEERRQIFGGFSANGGENVRHSCPRKPLILRVLDGGRRSFPNFYPNLRRRAGAMFGGRLFRQSDWAATRNRVGARRRELNPQPLRL